VPKFFENVFVLPWVELRVVAAFQLLHLKVELVKQRQIWHIVYLDGEHSFYSFIAFSKFAHCSIMNGIAPPLVLSGQDLAIPINDVF